MPATVDADAARVAHRDQNGGEDSEEADPQDNRAQGNGVKDAALRIEIGSRHKRQNGERAGNVHEGDERAGAEDGAGQGAARIAHFFAHGGDQFEAGEGEGDLRPEIDRVPVPRGHHVAEREVGRGAMTQANQIAATPTSITSGR